MICKVNLPEVWKVIQLGDVVSAQYGKALTGKSRLSSGPYNVVGSSGIVGKHNEFLIETPCIVIGRKGSVGAVYLMSAPSWPIDTTYFVLLPDGLQIKYLYYLLGFLNLARLDKSTAIPGINRGDLYRTQIPLAPTGEQTRIVEKLEELFSDLDAGVAELKATQKKLTQYRQSLLKAAVEGTLTAQWRAERVKSGEPLETGAQLLERILIERRRRWEEKQLAKFKEQGKTPPKDWRDKYPEPVKPKTADLPELPEGWVWVSVDCLISGIEAGKNFSCEGRLPTLNEVGIVKVSAVSWGQYNEKESKTCINPQRINEAYFIHPSDFLFSRANTIELVGACVIVHGVNLKLMLSDKILRLVFVKEVLKEWLLFVLRSQLGRTQIENLSTGNQESMRNIGQERIRKIAVPLPLISEVNYICSELSNYIQIAANQQSSIELGLKQSAAQRQNILKAAFSGQLVPQDPNDEPASVLLERIRAERAARANESKQRSGRRKAKGA